jgi:hypothetical protein
MSGKPRHTRIFVAVGMVIAVIVIAGSIFYSMGAARLQTGPVFVPLTMSLRNFSLCSSNCVYPSPYLSGEILFNGSAPLSSLHLLVNNTSEGYNYFNDSTTHFTYLYRGSFQNPPVVTGQTYWIKFAATFKDNTEGEASILVVAR